MDKVKNGLERTSPTDETKPEYGITILKKGKCIFEKKEQHDAGDMG
jgi:hypothetical protein